LPITAGKVCMKKKKQDNKSQSHPSFRGYAGLIGFGLLCAFLSLIIVPEIFGSLAIIFGAYVWRMEREDSRNRGLIVLILGIIFMIIGIYFTSYFPLGKLFY
jgi:membrane-bound ClpP family serine protease